MPEPWDRPLPGLDGAYVGVPIAPICAGHVTACRECGAPIVWAMTGEHRAMPVNPTASPAGNVELTAGRGGLHCTVLPKRDQHDRDDLHLSHFVTCPQAAKVRNRRRTPNGPAAR